jgi:hypothetical protein
MLGALKAYAESQKSDNKLQKNLDFAINLLESVQNSQTSNITFNGKSANNVANVSISPMMELRSLKIDIAKVVDVSQITPEARKVLYIIAQAIQDGVLEAYKDAQGKIIDTITEGSNSENSNET